jgi:hypothetical protein
MSITIVQINFKSNEPLNGHYNTTPIQAGGLLGQVQLRNEGEQEAGAVYIFENDEAAQAYLQSSTVTQLRETPAISDVVIKLFDIVEGVVEVRDGPASHVQSKQAVSLPMGRPIQTSPFYRYSV